MTFRELSSSGLTRPSIKAALAAGELRLVRRGIYARPGACEQVTRAAAHGGSIACTTAARHLGLWVLDHEESTHVWLRAHGRRNEHDGCSCVSHWDDATLSDAFGVPSVRQTLRQILLCRGVEQFFVTLESARRQRKLTVGDVAWLRERVPAAGHDAISFSRDDADSGLESLLRWRLRPHDLRLRAQVPIVAVGTVDFLIGDRLIVEVDGAGNHEDEPHRHRDLVRDANAAAWGYVTLRFDYAMVVHDWPTVELAILAHVDRGRHLL